MPKRIAVRGPDGKMHPWEIAGETPTPEELQAASDQLYGGKTGVPGVPSIGEAASAQSPERQMLNQARAADRITSDKYETMRQTGSAGLGMAGALIGGAMGGPLGAGIGGAAGAAAGPFFAELSEEARKARESGLGLSAGELGKEALGQAATSAAIDLTTAGVGKIGKGIIGLGKAADVAAEIEKGAEVGVRTAPYDLGRPWLETYKRVTSIIPILGAPARQLESNRSAEIARSVQRFMGPWEPLITESGESSRLLRAAATTHSQGVPWYKELYKETDRLGRDNPNLAFDATQAISEAKQFDQLVEQGRRTLSPVAKTSTSTTRTATRYSAERAVSERSKGIEGLIRETEGGQSQERLVGPQTTEFEKALESNKGITSSEVGQASRVATTTRQTIATPEAKSFEEARDAASLLKELTVTDPEMNYFQLDRTLKDIDAVMPGASNWQKTALIRVRDALIAASENSNDATFNVVRKAARENMAVLKEFFENPQAQKFKLVDKDVFGDFQALGSVERKNVDELYRTLFTPELGPQGVEEIAKLVGPEQMRRATILNIRQRTTPFFTAEDGRINWSGLYREFGFDNKSGLRYETFKKMLESGRFGMSPEEYEAGLRTLERYGGEQLPALATQYIRSISLGGPAAMLGNFSGSRAFNAMGGESRNIFGKLLAKVGVIGAITGLRDFSRFLADPDRLKVAIQYAQLDEKLATKWEGGVPVPGSKVSGLLPYTSTEVGAGGRLVTMDVNKKVRHQLGKQLLRWLAFDMGSALGATPQERRVAREQLYDDMVWALENPPEARRGSGPGEAFAETPIQKFQQAESAAERKYEDAKGLFGRYLEGFRKGVR